MEILCIIGILIYIFSQIIESGTNERLTKEGVERANRNDSLVYYDQNGRCYRSTKTGQKASRYVTQDVNGEWYEYIVTDPPFHTVVKGDFIEARYLNKNKWNEPIKHQKYMIEEYFGGK